MMITSELMTPDGWSDYELVDCGGFEKLERFGRYLVARPEPQAVWDKSLGDREWLRRADAYFRRDPRGLERSGDRGEWTLRPGMPQQWWIGYRIGSSELKLRLGLTSFKHVGVFPEQAANWVFIDDQVRRIACLVSRQDRTADIANQAAAASGVQVLNLFAYTGGATLACARAGASVCHVDASKGMTQWARENAALSGLSDRPIRWIVDDCEKFVAREIRRNRRYDAIIMDPPSYGRGPGGEIWKLEDCIYDLVQLCAGVLTEQPLFFLINSYTTGLSPSVMGYILGSVVRKRFGGTVTFDEIGLPVAQSGLALPCGSTAIWQAE